MYPEAPFTKRPHARFARPPRPTKPVAPLEPRLPTLAEIQHARKRRPSARFGRALVAGAMLTAAACSNATTAPDVADAGDEQTCPEPAPAEAPASATYLVARNNGGTPAGDDARLVAALCLASQLPGVWSCEQSDLTGARCRGEDEGEVVELTNCSVQTTANLPTSAIVCAFSGAAGDGQAVLPIFTGSQAAAVLVAHYHFDDDGYVDQCLLQDLTYRSITHD